MKVLRFILILAVALLTGCRSLREQFISPWDILPIF
jgi:hypothetical protein